MREVLFKTPHGSNLYGLANDNSDKDYYTVVTKEPVDNRYGRQSKARYAKQKIVGDGDSMVVDFGTWVEMCKDGVPQALEAMFSPIPMEDRIGEFRRDFRVGTGVYNCYMRTIKSFAFSENDPYKRKRHSLRLALNLYDMRKYNRFNPMLSAERARYVTKMAHMSSEDVYDCAVRLAWSTP